MHASVMVCFSGSSSLPKPCATPSSSTGPQAWHISATEVPNGSPLLFLLCFSAWLLWHLLLLCVEFPHRNWGRPVPLWLPPLGLACFPPSSAVCSPSFPVGSHRTSFLSFTCFLSPSFYGCAWLEHLGEWMGRRDAV